MEERHSIRAVAKKTGLSPYLIRAWEKRYNAVTPTRTATKRRLYSESDIERLLLLRKAIRAGESIGHIAYLPSDSLKRLGDYNPEIPVDPNSIKAAVNGQEPIINCVNISIEAIRTLNTRLLESTLIKAMVNFNRFEFLNGVITPILFETGQLWKSGEIKIAHEHAASAIIRTILGGLLGSIAAQKNASVLVATTLAGDRHEFGAMMAAIVAASLGWNAIYLGPDSPAEDIAKAIMQENAKAVLLSIVYHDEYSNIESELLKLRKYIGNDMAILIGGPSAHYFGQTLDLISAIRINDRAELRLQLEVLNAQS